MDELELTQLFVEYAQARDRLENLRQDIVDEVIKRGASYKIAGVEAKYYKPSFETPDYEGAIQAWMERHPEDSHAWMGQFSTTTTTVRWKEACEYLLIEVPPTKEKPARVVVK